MLEHLVCLQNFAIPKNTIINVLVHDSLYACEFPQNIEIETKLLTFNYIKYWKILCKAVEKISSSISSVRDHCGNTFLATQKTGKCSIICQSE